MGQLKQELDRRIGPRFNNRPALSPRALGEPDPRFSGGLGGFIAQDPMGFAKGLGSAPFTAAPDILGLVQQGSNALGNIVQRRLGLPEVGFQPISGDPIRESIGLDPSNPQGITGEVVSPVGTIAKGLGIAAKSVVAGAKLAANTKFPAELAMVLFHGSPFKFDKFKLSQIGTGEGAQAFGHGLYFAENKGVAQSYAQAGSRNSKFDQGSQFEIGPDNLNGDGGFSIFQQEFRATGQGDFERTSRDFRLDDLMADRNDELFASRDEALKFLKDNDLVDSTADFDKTTPDFREIFEDGGGVVQSRSPNLYEVEIPDSVTNRMLDWDAPLSEQPESVRRALDALPDPKLRARINGKTNLGNELNGGHIYDEIQRYFSPNRTSAFDGPASEGAVDASQELSEIGIPGIRYFDGNSRYTAGGTLSVNKHGNQWQASINTTRGVGSAKKFDTEAAAKAWGESQLEAERQTRNIVVFNPDDITQVKRDGEKVFGQ